MIELCEELRKIFLNEQGVEFSSKTLNIQKQAFNDAKTLFHEQIHPLFYSLWGEVWINKSQISGDSQNQSIHLWYVSLHGITHEQVAKAINDYINDDKGKYPPNSLEFRLYCQKYNNNVQSIDKTSKYAILN